MRAVINFFFLQGKAPKEIHAILTETLVCFLPGRAKDLSAASMYSTSLYLMLKHLELYSRMNCFNIRHHFPLKPTVFILKHFASNPLITKTEIPWPDCPLICRDSFSSSYSFRFLRSLLRRSLPLIASFK